MHFEAHNSFILGPLVVIVGFAATLISWRILKRNNRLTEPLAFYLSGFMVTAVIFMEWLRGQNLDWLALIIWWIGLPALYYFIRWNNQRNRKIHTK